MNIKCRKNLFPLKFFQKFIFLCLCFHLIITSLSLSEKFIRNFDLKVASVLPNKLSRKKCELHWSFSIFEKKSKRSEKNIFFFFLSQFLIFYGRGQKRKELRLIDWLSAQNNPFFIHSFLFFSTLCKKVQTDTKCVRNKNLIYIKTGYNELGYNKHKEQIIQSQMNNLLRKTTWL